MAVKPSLFGGSGKNKAKKNDLKTKISPDVQENELEDDKSWGGYALPYDVKHEGKNYSKENATLAWISIVLVIIFPLIGLIIAVYAFMKCRREGDDYNSAIALGAVIMGIFIMVISIIMLSGMFFAFV